jgi:phosphatidate phosphatase LPIN
MRLKHGKNIGKFELDLGEETKKVVVTMKIFLWNAQEKIVVSDIDGTITKSDILGQILGQMRYKWFHTGVTRLYTEIYKRNYKIVYLTARAIGQYEQTSKFLESVE